MVVAVGNGFKIQTKFFRVHSDAVLFIGVEMEPKVMAFSALFRAFEERCGRVVGPMHLRGKGSIDILKSEIRRVVDDDQNFSRSYDNFT